MADKTATAIQGTTEAAITTAGATAIGITTFVFDEAAGSGAVLDNLERTKVAVLKYFGLN
jgi:hypothetical protein